MRELFIDCSLGVAGDMLASALLELCPYPNQMLDELNNMGIPGIMFIRETVERYGITGSHLRVLYNGLEEKPGCSEGSEPITADTTQKGVQRHLNAVYDIIDKLNITESTGRKAREAYQLLAEAEASIHGSALNQIHFHELGTMDAIADICAVSYLINELSVKEITVSPIRTGFGRIRSTHGMMPVPAPATAMLLCGIPSFAGSIEGELCTPTGVALVKSLATDYGRSPAMVTERIGYGMGMKDFGQLTCVRASIGRAISF